MAEASLIIKIDDVAISKRPNRCRAESNFCSVVLSVDDELLRRLMNGLALVAEVQGGIKLYFPLQDFARSRRAIL